MREEREFGRRNLPSSSPLELSGLSYIANISISGAFVKTNEVKDIDDTFGMRIKLPLKHSPEIKANCIVRWVNIHGDSSPWKVGMGVEFKNISAKSKEWIQKYVELITPSASKRKFLRSSANLKLEYQYEKKWIQVKTVNLCQEGLFLHTKNLVPLESPLPLKLYFPDVKNPLSTQGIVKWINEKVPPKFQKGIPVGFGVQFYKMKLQQKTKIQKFLATFKKES